MIQQRRFRLEHLPTRHTLKQIVLSLLLSLFRLREIIERENALHLFRLLPTFSLSLPALNAPPCSAADPLRASASPPLAASFALPPCAPAPSLALLSLLCSADRSVSPNRRGAARFGCIGGERRRGSCCSSSPWRGGRSDLELRACRIGRQTRMCESW